MSRQKLFERILGSLHAGVLDDTRWPGTSALIDEFCDPTPTPCGPPLSQGMGANDQAEGAMEKSAVGHASPGTEPGKAGAHGVQSTLGRWLARAAFGLAVTLAGPALAQDNYDLRITGPDAGDARGHVELFHDGDWGMICDDFWDQKDARVACRQLGYQGARGYFIRLPWSNGSVIMLDNVNCDGSETRLIDCRRHYNVEFGENNCGLNEGAGVHCDADTDENAILVNPDAITVDEQAAAGASYDVRLGKEPSADVTVTIGGTTNTDVTTSATTLTFTTANWNVWQTVTVTAANDTDYLDDTATLTHTASGGGYGTAASTSVAVTVLDNTVDDSPTVKVKPTAITVEEEDTAGATYEIRLKDSPTADVTITVGGTSGTDLTVSPATLTFTSANWRTWQSVTVTAANDADATDDTATITHTAAGGGYGTADIDSVAVTVHDNDTPGVSVSANTKRVAVNEGDTAGNSYELVLTRAPTATVTMTVSGHAGTGITVNPSTLTFTTTNWARSQTVTLTAPEDANDTSEEATLAHSASGGGYDSVIIESVFVFVRDNEARVQVQPAELTLDEGESATYTLETVGSPWRVMVVNITAGPGLSVDPSQVVFRRNRWSNPRTITVTAVPDDDWDHETITITHTVQGAPGVVAESVEVGVRETGTPAVHLTSSPIVTLEEGEGETYGIFLGDNPLDTATVTITAPSKLGVTPQSLTFDETNWQRTQNVRIEALQDADSSDERMQIRHQLTIGSNSKALPAIRVDVRDDDDGEALVGPRPADALWWAALTARRETGGAVGYLDYEYSNGADAGDTGKLSDSTFILRGVTREIEGLFVQGGTLQVWVDSGDGFQLPNNLVLHVGNEAVTLGSASRQSFETTYADGQMPTMRDHTYWWYSGTHSVSLSDRQVVAVWLEDPSGTYLPSEPRSVQATAKDSAVELKWTAPPEVPSKPVTHYEYQKSNSDEWTATDGPETTTEVKDLVNGDTYKFRLRAVNDAGKGAASAPSEPVTPSAPGLTAEFGSVPSSHDGSTAFTLGLEFSEDTGISFRTLRDHAFEVTGGTVTRARRAERGSNIGWRITVEPDTDGDVVVSLPARACEESGAVCTADDQPLEEAVSATVPGPASGLPEVSVAAGSSPVTEGSDAVFTLTRAGDTSAELTVALSVTEDGAVLAGTPPAEAVFAAGSGTTELTVATQDDEAAEDASAVTVAFEVGTGYTVDANGTEATVTVADDDAAPEIAGAGPFTVDENATAVATLAATDEDTPVADLVWSIAGGADAAAFVLSDDGVLAFAAAKDFEAPDDTDTDGTWAVTVQVSDGVNETQAALEVQLADVDDVAPLLTDASVDGTSLALTWDEALDEGSAPGADAFTVTVDGASRGVGAVAVAGSSTVLTLASAVEAGETVTVSYTVPAGPNANPLRDLAGNEAAGFSDGAVTNATAPGNTAPTGLPAIEGTARVGETLAASATDIVDADGLADAVFVWRWIANDGMADADIAGATGASYTLTAAEAGKTVKVRVTFTDEGMTEETLVSDPTAAVEAALPVVSIEADSSPVTEGAAAAFTLRRTGAVASALTLPVSVTETGSVVSGALPATVTFAAGSAEAVLSVATEDDGVAEADGRVTASVSPGSGYDLDANASAAAVDVYDNDEVVSTTVETLWTTTLEWQGDYGNGWVNADAEDFSSPDWSEDGDACRIWYMAYGSASGELWLRVNSDLCAGGIPEPETLALHLGDVTVGPGDALSTFARRDVGIATGVEADWTAGEQIQVRLTRTEAGEAVASGPGLSVEDAQVQEAEGAALAFRVTLDTAHTSTVSVRYATSDGTASAGADYEAVSGALRFAPGETAKTVSVRVRNDTHDEGSETLTLSLSRPFGADIGDGEAVGTIVNTGPMPRAWITRFGRTVALQAVEAIGDRMSGARGTQVVVGGVALGGSGELPGAGLDDEASWPAGAPSLERSGLSGVERGMTGRELLLGSAFQLEAAGEDGDRSWSAWGRFATSGFDGEEAGASLSGDVTTGFLGADLSVERWLAGLALGVSEGEGAFDDGAGGARGTVQSSLASVYPYARLSVGDGTDVWGLAGIGSGDLTLRVGEEVTETGLSMRMGALGVRSELVPGAQTGAFALALKSDALWVRTDSDAARTSTGGKLEAASGGASRLRAALEGSRSFAVGLEATFTPTVELGLRHDGGDAETGTGVEVGVGLQYADPARGLTIGGSVRGLLAHSDDGYEEWGASGSIRLDPGTTGRGLSLSITPVWGAASGGVETLWSARTASGLVSDGGFEGAARLEAEMGYGFALAENAGVLTPYMGLGAGEDGRREYRIGTRWHAGSHASVSLDVSREEVRGAGTATDALMLRAALRF